MYRVLQYLTQIGRFNIDHVCVILITEILGIIKY
jgi:hypothetical protein